MNLFRKNHSLDIPGIPGKFVMHQLSLIPLFHDCDGELNQSVYKTTGYPEFFQKTEIKANVHCVR